MYSQSRRGVREHTHKYKLTKTLAVASKAIAGCKHIAETHIKGVESELRGIKSSPPPPYLQERITVRQGCLIFQAATHHLLHIFSWDFQPPCEDQRQQVQVRWGVLL